MRKKHKTGRVLAALVLLCAALILDSNYRIVTREYLAGGERVPAGLRGLRIVQISDTHAKLFGKNCSRLLAAVERARPDIIALTGDIIDEPGDIPAAETMVRGLCAIAPVYFVSGNHDWASHARDELADMLRACGAVYLQNEFVTVSRGGESIILAGVEDPNGPSDMKTPEELVADIRAAYPESCLVLLGHRNNWAERYPELDADLIFCGHGHGGIVRVPFAGGVFGTGGELFPEYDGGLYRVGHYDLVVSRGLAGVSFAPRVFNNPEIVAVTLG